MTMLSDPKQPTLNGPLAEAEALYLRERESVVAQLKKIDEILAHMRALRSVPRTSDTDLPPVVPDEYKGLKLSPALEVYLRARAGFKIPIGKVVEDLEIGGADMGGPTRHAHNLKITLSSRYQTFAKWDKDTDTVSLSETATLPPKKRIRKK